MIRCGGFPFWLALAAVFAGGCASTPPEIKANTSKVVQLDPASKRALIATVLAEEIRLQLPPIELPGYIWEVFAHDSRFLKQTTEILPPDAPGASPTVSFLAIRPTPRNTLLRFLLVKQSREKEDSPVDGYDVVVTVAPPE